MAGLKVKTSDRKKMYAGIKVFNMDKATVPVPPVEEKAKKKKKGGDDT